MNTVSTFSLRCKRLRKLLQSKELSFIMEAHNGLSAKIVQASGFKAVWASGLSIATSLGVRDANEISWSQMLGILDFMTDAVDIPILVDGDTGHGNFNNVRRLVQKLCQIGVAGICIEDKIFPKTNSFVNVHQSLESIEDFCGKIRAAKDHQTNENFSVVARTEALIVGAGIQEALKRTRSYFEAGADAILIHSKKTTAEEILSFAKSCPHNIPTVIVPTKYFSTPTESFRKAGINCVIWANQSLRTSINAMKKTTKTIKEEESCVNIEKDIASLQDIFQIVDQEELQTAERKYVYQQ